MFLAINTASSETQIALLNQGHELIAEQKWLSQNNEAEKLMPEINQLCQDQGVELKKIKEVLVIRGPGSFTGLRVGVTVANTIRFLNQSKLFAIDTFEYLWQKAPSEEENLALLVFAGSGGVYFSSRDQKGTPEIINIDQLAGYLKKSKVKKVFGDISDEQKSKLGSDLEYIETKTSFGQTMSIYLKKNQKKLEHQEIINPRYIKSPGITPSKKNLLNK